MATTEEQKAYIREIAFEAAETVSKRIERQLETAIKLHAATCPTTRAVMKSRAFIAGMACVCGAIGSVITLIAKGWFY